MKLTFLKLGQFSMVGKDIAILIFCIFGFFWEFPQPRFSSGTNELAANQKSDVFVNLTYHETPSQKELKVVMVLGEPFTINDSTIVYPTFLEEKEGEDWLSYRYPYRMFVLGGVYKSYRLIDSMIFDTNWRRSLDDFLVVDMTLSEGGTVRTLPGESGGGFILESKEPFWDHYTSYVFSSTLYSNRKIRFNYVHNLGFLWEELIFPDSTIRRELVEINGVPIETYISVHPEFKFFNN